jgi:hypothetical protein
MNDSSLLFNGNSHFMVLWGHRGSEHELRRALNGKFVSKEITESQMKYTKQGILNEFRWLIVGAVCPTTLK